MSGYTSVKWIVSDGGQLRVNDTKSVLQPIWNQTCNLISIFGRARQGKSFLMNCLAGEREIFRISNEKESCTQGIDISNKWMTIKEFATVDGGRSEAVPSTAQGIRVGFVDAEGQGDKDVSYDANLICPILLASKCVIFNWKGDLQKDHILNTLGIMCRAAQNVGVESSGSSGSKFGHLHIVFRDWQAVGSDAQSTYDMLFGAEPNTSETALRNKIRLDLHVAFASIQVWLFDAPTDLVSDLKKKLTLDKTSIHFKAQVRNLRSALMTQLQQPVVFGGQVLTGRMLHGAVTRMVDSLNSGQVVLPGAAYRAMLKDELYDLQQQALDELSSLSSNTLHTLLHDHTLYHAVSSVDEEVHSSAAGLFPSTTQAQAMFDSNAKHITAQYIQQAKQILHGTEGNSSLHTLQLEFETALEEGVMRAKELFVACYNNAFHDWLLTARLIAEGRIKRLFAEIRNRQRSSPISPVDINSTGEIGNAYNIIIFTLDEPAKHDHSPAYRDSLHLLKALFDQAVKALQDEIAEEHITHLVAHAGQEIQSAIEDGSFSKQLLLQYPHGFPLASLTAALNSHFTTVSQALQSQLTGLKTLSSFRLKEILAAFEAQVGATLQPLLVTHYASLRRQRLTDLLPHAQSRLNDRLFELATAWEERNPPPSFETEARVELHHALDAEVMHSLHQVAGWLVEDIPSLHSLPSGGDSSAGWQQAIQSEFHQNVRNFLLSALLPFEIECEELLASLAEEYEQQQLQQQAVSSAEAKHEPYDDRMDDGEEGYDDEDEEERSNQHTVTAMLRTKSSAEEQRARAKAWADKQFGGGGGAGKKGKGSSTAATSKAAAGSADDSKAGRKKAGNAPLTSYGRKRQRAIGLLTDAARGHKSVEEQRRAALEFAESVFGPEVASISPEKHMPSPPRRSSASSSSTAVMAPAPAAAVTAVKKEKGKVLEEARAAAAKANEDRIAEMLAKRKGGNKK
jgi:hypothetical protein